MPLAHSSIIPIKIIAKHSSKQFTHISLYELHNSPVGWMLYSIYTLQIVNSRRLNSLACKLNYYFDSWIINVIIAQITRSQQTKPATAARPRICYISLGHKAGTNRKENRGCVGRVTCLRSQRVAGPGLNLGLADANTFLTMTNLTPPCRTEQLLGPHPGSVAARPLHGLGPLPGILLPFLPVYIPMQASEGDSGVTSSKKPSLSPPPPKNESG